MSTKYPPRCIPNTAGYKLIVHLKSGESVEAEVIRDESGCHCLRLLLTAVESWSRPEANTWEIAPPQR